MKKTFIMLIAAGLMTSSAFAQLSKRVNDATVEKLGGRPQEGDGALTYAIDLVQDLSLLGSNPGDSSSTGLPIKNRLFTGDLLTYKYYIRNNTAIRVGFRFYKNSERIKGEESDSATGYMPLGISEAKVVRNVREIALAGGPEKHFSIWNIFDVYTAADLYLGFNIDKTVRNETRVNGDMNNMSKIDRNFVLGAEWVSGFNIFIAHLPVSIGLEYGLGFKWGIGKGVSKVKEEVKIGTTEYTLEYKTDDDNVLGYGSGLHYNKLGKQNFSMNTNQNVRVTLNIYFTKKEKNNNEIGGGNEPIGTQY